MHGVVVKKSKIEGKGVFAARNFKKGEIVLKWDTSHELTSERVKKMSEGEKRYVTCLDGKYVLMQPPERYVNHSCDANTFVRDFCDVAKRDIKKDEEITSNYADTSLNESEFVCKCGSKNCKKIIRM